MKCLQQTVYPGRNLTLLSGMTDPPFVLQRVGYPFTFQARNRRVHTDVLYKWDLLLYRSSV
jgi:hypothetical protein